MITVAVAKRELIPLTTGLISDVKRKRTAKMRHMIRLKKQSVLKIQVFIGSHHVSATYLRILLNWTRVSLRWLTHTFFARRHFGDELLSDSVCVWSEIRIIRMTSSCTGQFATIRHCPKSPSTSTWSRRSVCRGRRDPSPTLSSATGQCPRKDIHSNRIMH